MIPHLFITKLTKDWRWQNDTGKPEVRKRIDKGKNDKKTIKMSASDFREIFGEQKYIT